MERSKSPVNNSFSGEVDENGDEPLLAWTDSPQSIRLAEVKNLAWVDSPQSVQLMEDNPAREVIF